MNKLMIAATLAGGLLLANAPEAAAHPEVRHAYGPPGYYHPHDRYEMRRASHMPRWLKRHRGFRHWYHRTPLKRNKRLAWYELFEIYRWERRWGRSYSRSPNYWNDYFAYRYRQHERRYDDRYDDDDRRRGRRHRHDD